MTGHPMTWESYWTWRIIGVCVAMALAFVILVIKLLVDWWEAMHVNDARPSKGPGAGKTLGL
jgi:hypothetical protein